MADPIRFGAVLEALDRTKAGTDSADKRFRRLAGNIGKYCADALTVLGGIGIIPRIGRIADTALQATPTQEAAEAVFDLTRGTETDLRSAPSLSLHVRGNLSGRRAT